ncbi:MAG TPA: BTAD domain-containing putative transcriptional regulator [Acidimicrobiales bacterium]
MRFEVLGHLRARSADSGSDEAALGGPKQRLVLALLLARPNEVVSTDRLIDEVWGEDVPGTARHTLQSYVSELRKTVGPVLERTGPGYTVRVDADGLDALEFEVLVSEGAGRVDTDPARASSLLNQALDLWHGAPFSDFAHHDALLPEIARLEELYLSAQESLMRAELALGRHHAVISRLEQLTHEHPYREELRALHMLALYRAGRQADALRAYQRTRKVLAEELGIDPSPALSRLEEQILVQDPVLEGQAVTQTPPELVAAAEPTVNPYKGLRSFREQDRDGFFGRGALVEQVLRALEADARMVSVVGPSGSGKSSVIAAGVIPAFRDHLASEHVVVATMQPGSHPFTDLEGALARAADSQAGFLSQVRDGDTGLLRAAVRILPENGRLLLVIDQFEELFTLVAESERAQFVQALVTASSDARHRVQILVALRADYYDRPLRDRELARLFTENVVPVLPLSADELEAAAVQPAQRAGLTIEPRLLGALIADVRDQPHALPLFQYALTELYDRREGSTLTHAGYQAFGGLRRAVANRAEALYEALDSEQREAARQLFLRLVAVAGDDEGRRRIPASELTLLEVDLVALQAAIQAFSRHRLLSLDRDPATGSPTVEVAHDALLTEWARLRSWLDDAHDDLRVHRGFSAAVTEWLAAGRDPEYLLSGGRLAEYERWAASTTLRLTAPEREFLDRAIERRDAAEAAEQARVATERKLRRGTRLRTWALAAAVAALVGVGVAAMVNRGGGTGPTVALVGFERGYSSIDTLAVDGLERAAREHGVEPVVLGKTFSDVNASLAEIADKSGLVILSFDLPLDPAVIRDHPDTTWLVLDAQDAVPGVPAVSFAVNEGSFVVGAAAALESKTGVVGFIGGMQFPHIESFRAGFEAGVHAVNPDVDVLAAYVSAGDTVGFELPERASTIATSMYTRGADVVFHAAGASGTGVFEAAYEQSRELGRQLWGIGVDSDQYLELPQHLRDHVLTSMIKRFDQGVYESVSAYLDGKLKAEERVFGLAEGGVGYTTSGNNLSSATIDRVDALAKEVIAGTRTVPYTPTGAVDPPLGSKTQTRARVTWDGKTCRFEGPNELRFGEIIRIEASNLSRANAQVWAEWTDRQGRVGVELAPGATSTADYEAATNYAVDIACYPSLNGRLVGDGRVHAATLVVNGAEAGTYTAASLGRPMQYTLADGWWVEDKGGHVGFAPPGWTEWWPLLVLQDVGAASQTCKAAPEAGVGTDAASIAAWLANHSGLDATAPTPVEVGGLRGQRLRLTVRSDWTGKCDQFGGDPVVAILARSAGNGMDAWLHYAAPGWWTEVWLLDHPDAGTTAVLVDVEGDSSRLDSIFERVKPVFDSLRFDAS